MATAYQKQLAEWQEEDQKLFAVAFKDTKGFSGSMLQMKRGHRHKRFDPKLCKEVTIAERIANNNRKYDGLNRGRKGVNPVTAYK